MRGGHGDDDALGVVEDGGGGFVAVPGWVSVVQLVYLQPSLGLYCHIICLSPKA